MVAADASAALFQPLKVGEVTLQHRVAMAPLTRFRADNAHVHQDIAVEYYSQRASAPGTLLITEATFIAPQAAGYPNVPGIWNDAQIAAWKKIVDAVHAKGSFIFLQLWALGRAARPDVLKAEGGYDVVSASDVPFEGGATPRALTADEIAAYPGLYAQAAKNFVELAGGDGVEVHGANGYLVDQFLQSTSNKRTDKYGGSVENRARFGLEVVDAVVAAVGAKRTAIRVSPFSPYQGMKMENADIKETFSYFATALKKAHPELAYLHAVEGRIAGNVDVGEADRESLDFLYDIWTPGVFLDAGGFKTENALATAEKRKNSVIVFGRYFIANADLVTRVRHDLAFNDYDRDKFYHKAGTQDPSGYTDYPLATEIKARA